MSNADLDTAPAPVAVDPARALLVLLDEVPDDRALGAWRWRVRRQLVPLLGTVTGADEPAGDGLAARQGGCRRDEEALGRRIAAMAHRVVGDADTVRLCRDLRLLLADVRRHRQRCRDLAYDEVELELGGSE